MVATVIEPVVEPEVEPVVEPEDIAPSFVKELETETLKT